MRSTRSFAILILIAAPILLHATVFATLHGVVHDPQHRPIVNAQVTLKATESAFTLNAVTASNGTFEIPQIPIGVYRLTVFAPGFANFAQPLTITSSTNPVLHIPLAVADSEESVVVSASNNSAEELDAISPNTLISRADIDETPGASRTLGMEMITDYVPGAYMTHDMLHMRGGHQTSWLIDGIAEWSSNEKRPRARDFL